MVLLVLRVQRVNAVGDLAPGLSDKEVLPRFPVLWSSGLVGLPSVQVAGNGCRVEDKGSRPLCPWE